MGVSQNQGSLFGGPNNKHYNIWDLYWGPLSLGNYHIRCCSVSMVCGYCFFWGHLTKKGRHDPKKVGSVGFRQAMGLQKGSKSHDFSHIQLGEVPSKALKRKALINP